MSRQNKQAKKIKIRKEITAMRKSGQKGYNLQKRLDDEQAMRVRQAKEKANVVAKKKSSK